MINYSRFNITNDHAYNLFNAINYCREIGDDCLVFDCGRYDIYPEKASERLLHVSNHDIYGEKRIAFLIEQMENFTVDGGGSEFVFHSDMIPFALVGSNNITIKNLSIDYEKTKAFCLKVTAVDEESFDFSYLGGSECYVNGTTLYISDGDGKDEPFRYFCLLNDGTSKEMIAESRDSFDRNMYFEKLDDGLFRVHNKDKALELREGMVLVARAHLRHACNVVIDRCKDTTIDNVTMYKSYGMGVLAEKSINVTIDKMTVKAREEDYFSLNADATHFVNCKGLVKVTNSSFSEQQDDALNIHGEFNPVTEKDEESVLVKYVHPQAKGLSIYEVGDEIAVLAPKTLIPKFTRKITAVQTVNMNYTRLFIEGGTDGIEVGDVFEDLTWNCDLIFENNKVRNNRARGMLIATKGKVEIKNNYFNTPGVAILFESDGKFWFEAGGTQDVRILDNTFDNCRFTKGNWGKNVIEIKPRKAFDGENYYHKYIEVSGNKFVGNGGSLLSADNVERFVWKNNSLESCSEDSTLTFRNCGQVDSDTAN